MNIKLEYDVCVDCAHYEVCRHKEDYRHKLEDIVKSQSAKIDLDKETDIGSEIPDESIICNVRVRCCKKMLVKQEDENPILKVANVEKRNAAIKEILEFISLFRERAEHFFIYEGSYWFAHILSHRFENSFIAYRPEDNHFACCIDLEVYDVRGYVDSRGFIPWASYKENNPNEARPVGNVNISMM